MGGRNRRWHNSKSHYDGPRRPPPPPPPPGPGHSDGNNQCPVPLWEREFCCHVGGISWKRFCENKQFSSIYKDIEQWDDSAAFENFQNAKSRFCAHYHGQSSDIPLPDPDMYIDRVDHSCEVDPELVAELDKVRLPFEADNVYAPATGWGNTEANNKCAPNQSGNWDIYLEKLSESNKWEDSSRPNTGWGEKHDPLNKWSKDSSGWGDALVKPLNQWSKNSSGWGAALVNPSWGSSSNNYCPPNNWNSGHANNDQWSTYGRKRNSGGGCSQQSIDIAMNRLDGAIPDDLFDAPKLETVHLYSNSLTGPVPESAAKAPSLVELRLFTNRLNGTLPSDLGKNTPLVCLDLSDNSISGEIPRGICDRGELEELLMLDNALTGRIPEGLGRCHRLRRVRLSNNRLDGDVPGAVWGLPHIALLELNGNRLTGEISPVIAGAANLSKLVISNNRLSGSIPSEIGSAAKLYEFSADGNMLSGPLPSSLGSLAELGRLVLRNNSLSGQLLRGFHSWKKLSELNLADNSFTGGIPPELGDLPVLNYLDLSGNRLSGEVPIQLENLKLNQFNVSNNQLSGQLPPQYATEAYRSSFVGNPGLCGEITGLCATSQGRTGNHSGFVWMMRSIFIFAAVVLVAGIAWFYWRYRTFNKARLSADRSKWTLTSFHKLSFSEYDILDCLDEDNVIGSGASGKVYKAVLGNGEIVAVKKLWGGALKKDMENSGEGSAADNSFEAEVRTLGKIRHKNIVKLLCCCTHNDCKLLVYEYMPNGSLGDVLHSSKAGLLDWPTRYKVALDAAEGLSYLHQDCVPAIVHRDVKSNNILLDAEFGACVADFGVAKVLEATDRAPKSMSVIAGSCGYIAPEYAYTLRVNEKSDIYSFGVVLLELVTGKPPVDPEFGEKDLVKWVCSTIDQKGVEPVLDSKLDMTFKEEISRVLNIGLMCASSLPINRPAMRRVVKMLQEVRAEERQRLEKDGKLSPYYYEDSSDQGSSV